ncbi:MULTISPECIES: alpha/beta hydrolase [Thermus]|uniref:alpha/beta hydrolase n=1 Tax=Thermus brockianus TaxID=56956 RepID=UPI001F203407|nr:CocE/NonD family hydrolase [Thermus brockianus]
MRRAFWLGFLTLFLAACGTQGGAPGRGSGEASQGSYQAAEYRSVTIPSFDGTPIALTVFQPALAPGETAPLILHGHGLGGHRIRGPEDTSTENPAISDALFAAWRLGYYVISFDQRGFGDSGGTVRVMDPEYEVRDVRAILDWAEANLPRFNGRVGTFGASYGGGFQLMTRVQDPRIRAMIPLVTWYDLPYSLFPNRVPKTAWNTLLLAAGALGSGGRMDPYIYQTYVESLLRGAPSSRAEAFFHYHSPSYFYERGLPLDPVDVLLVQGMRDTLFNLNEAYWNAMALLPKGGDVRLLTLQGGHVLPYLQDSTAFLPFGGGVDLVKVALAWFEEKLRGKRGAADFVPRLSVSLNNQEAVTFGRVEDLPVGGVGFDVPPTLLVPLKGISGTIEALLRVLRQPLAPYLPGGGDLPLVEGLVDALLGPVFVPLKAVTEPTVLAGIPRFRLYVEGALELVNPVIFVGLGVKKLDGSIQVVDEQVLPLKGFGKHEGMLVGVGEALSPGETLGLVLLGTSEQYLLHGSRLPFLAQVSGSVAVPTWKK